MAKKLGILKDKITSLPGMLDYLLLCFCVFILDQASKIFALLFFSNQSSQGFFGFSTISNSDFVFGWNFYLDSQFTSSLTAGILAAFTFYYIVFLHYTKNTHSYLKFGISFVFAGFFSNSMNKVLTGFVTDIFYINLSFLPKIYFNLADLFQILGWTLVIFGSKDLVKTFFLQKNYRKQIFVSKDQMQFVGFFLLAFFCLSFFFVLLNWQFINYLEKSSQTDLLISYSFFKYSILILIGISIFIASFLIYFSNSVYGPLFSFKRHIESLLKDKKTPDLKLRKRDQFKDFEDLAKKIKKSLK